MSNALISGISIGLLILMGIVVPQLDIDGIANCIKVSARTARNEEELRINVSTRCIEDGILKPLGITQYSGRYEYTLISGARIDALYGHVIVEYKAPGKLSSQSDIAKAKEQVIKYIQQEAASKAEWDRYLGVIISDRIAFVRYDRARDTWILRGPYEVTRESVIKLVEAIRGLRRKALSVGNILSDFGPTSPIARKAVKALYDKLTKPTSPRTTILFEDWMRLFKQATGYNPAQLRGLKGLAEEYGITGNSVDYDRLIFAIQTYYALILKLLAAEVTYLYGGGRFYKSYIAELDDAYTRSGVAGLKEALRELESGGVFRSFGIVNFLEGDYFSWYLEELDEKLADVIAEVVRRLSDYEPATPQLEPEFARDLLKRLYQDLVPEGIRHNLGEYYTPDWLADFILNEVGLSLKRLEELGKDNPTKPLELRVLDPACGSGTFLVRYIARLREYAREHYVEDVLLDYLLNNVVGYDLNPLAVLTARTNYLLMIADLPRRGTIEIPIYLTDSLMIEKRSTMVGMTYVLKTVVGEFQIPTTIVDRGLLPGILNEVTNALRNRYTPGDFRNRLRYRFKDLGEDELKVLTDLYTLLLRLEEEGKDEVWVSIIRNAFAPIMKGRFDYVVGNPPWVNWENLPEGYRQVSMELWAKYGLARTVKAGAFKRDLAMLFLARAFDLYLKPGGRLGFLLPFSVFKTQAGAGFREFLASKARILIIHDMVSLRPFEGVTNMTSAVIIEKPQDAGTPVLVNEVRRGVRNVIWINRLGGKPIPSDMQLEDVLKITERHEVIMTPVIPDDVSSPWMQVTRDVLPAIRRLVSGPRYYEAHAGVATELNQVYYINIIGKTPDGKLLVTNPPEPGQKKRVRQVKAPMEPDLVYPLVRGRNIERWFAEAGNRYTIIPYGLNGQVIPPSEMRARYPSAYAYFHTFYSELINRSGGFLREKLSIYKQLPLEMAEKKTIPFYSIATNIGPYTFAPYKVVWGRISSEGSRRVASFACAVVEPRVDKYLGVRPIVPDDSTILIGFNNPDEAYYVAGVLNSILTRALIASYTYEIGQNTHIVDIIKVPRFEPGNRLHRLIAALSRRAHAIARCIHASQKPAYCGRVRDPVGELARTEEWLDRVVGQLYGLSEDAIAEFRRLLAILSGES